LVAPIVSDRFRCLSALQHHIAASHRRNTSNHHIAAPHLSAASRRHAARPDAHLPKLAELSYNNQVISARSYRQSHICKAISAKALSAKPYRQSHIGKSLMPLIAETKKTDNRQ
jgi:hypothetical protein